MSFRTAENPSRIAVDRDGVCDGEGHSLVGHQDALDLVGHQDALDLVDHQDALGLVGHQDALGLVDHQDALDLVDHHALDLVDHQDALDLVDHQDALDLVPSLNDNRWAPGRCCGWDLACASQHRPDRPRTGTHSRRNRRTNTIATSRVERPGSCQRPRPNNRCWSDHLEQRSTFV
jgi:hypothetical protein